MKVYCEDCKYGPVLLRSAYYRSPKEISDEYCHCGHPNAKITRDFWFRKWEDSMLASEINKNNDCKWFEPEKEKVK